MVRYTARRTQFGILNVSQRTASVQRDTRETQINVTVNLDGQGQGEFATGVPFLEHMLDQIARHACINLRVECHGDTHIDDHHSVEDIGITLGMAVAEALGDRSGIYRYGHAYCPLDEALSRAVLDFSGRPGLHYRCVHHRDKVGSLDTELVYEFFQGFVNHAKATLHLDNLHGLNEHHKIETLFKAFGRALRQAVSQDPRMLGQIPSTKGSL